MKLFLLNIETMFANLSKIYFAIYVAFSDLMFLYYSPLQKSPLADFNICKLLNRCLKKNNIFISPDKIGISIWEYRG